MSQTVSYLIMNNWEIVDINDEYIITNITNRTNKINEIKKELQVKIKKITKNMNKQRELKNFILNKKEFIYIHQFI